MERKFEIMQSLSESPEFRGALDIISHLEKHSFQCYMVGGAVRDMLLGKKPKDFDLATNARPEQIMEIFPHSIPLGASFGVVTVVNDDNFAYEVATFREEREYSDGRHPEKVFYTDDVKLDVVRRDFTVNALIYDPVRSMIIDHTTGLDDMKHGVLRAIGDPERRFSEDYLRILRAVRFAARLGYEIDPATASAASKLAPYLVKISPERIRDEIGKMIVNINASHALSMLSELGILRVVLPEIEDMHGVEQPEKYHPEGDVFEHTLLMFKLMAYPSEELAWSILLHDVGKKSTQTFSDGIPHFYGHEKVGAEMSIEIMKRLRLPNSVCDAVESAVRNHMRFAHVNRMKTAKLKKLVADKNFPLELELHRLDCAASNGIVENYVFLLDKYSEFSRAGSAVLPKPFVTGRDLIEAGLKPSPKFKELLERIYELQLDGSVSSRDEALNILSSILGI